MSLTISAGIQNSGKSTWMKREVGFRGHDTILLSTDDFRTIITGDINDQSKNNIVYDVIKWNTAYFLKQKYDVLIDGTFVKKSWRKSFIDIGRVAGVPVYCVYFKISLEQALERNKNRKNGQNVPEEVIVKYYQQLEVPDLDEFDDVFVEEQGE